MQIELKEREQFATRHLGPDKNQVKKMLRAISIDSLDQLIDETIPQAIRKKSALNLPEPKGEYRFIDEFKTLMNQNKVYRNYIGMGYYNCIVPAVIQRNILENPGWYTAYTPYQAEIAQGRLEALINFQTAVIDLTGMEIANASLLDEATAAAEAMSMLFSLRKGSKKQANRFLVDENTFPQTLAVLKTRALPLGINLEIGNINKSDLSQPDLFGIFLQYPDGKGAIKDHTHLITAAKENQVFSVIAADLLSLVLLKSPGEMGADVAVGTTQRFGIPLGYGGPHAAYFATKDEFKRQIPGRIIGVSVDRNGKKAYRMALQTREQHIRREKATSNICTAQVLLAVMAGMYAVYHGAEGLKSIAGRINGLANLLNQQLKEAGFQQVNELFFDTLKLKLNREQVVSLKSHAEDHGINFRYFADDHVGISLDETTTVADIKEIIQLFNHLSNNKREFSLPSVVNTLEFSDSLRRKSIYLQHPVFNLYHSEHELLRYMKSLENKDLSLVHSMISLGSCTMKLNATTEMLPVSWPEVAHMHPFAP
ncbi:MAG: glycine dehydrogenase (aminomethyl-transferring), partial [Cyclobacteriaceae bacterium]